MKDNLRPIVLVYEENPTKKTSLYSLLESQQLNVVPCVNLQALRMLNLQEAPQIVVIDFGTNPHEKREACEIMRENPLFAKTNLLAALSEHEMPLACWHKEQLTYIKSPIFYGELFGAVHALLFKHYKMAN